MTEKIRIAVLVSGSGSNLQAIIDACRNGRVKGEIATVISNNADAGAIRRCDKAGVPWQLIDHRLYPRRDDFDRALIAALREARADLILLAGFMRVLGKAVIDAFPAAIMNIHPALLPSFSGLHAVRQALEYGSRYTGCTVHFIDHGVDTGPIILQAVVPVLDDDSEADLQARIREREHQIYPEAIQLFAEKRLRIEGRKVRILTPET